MSLRLSAPGFRALLLSCTRVFSPAIAALRGSALLVVIAFLLMCGSTVSAQENRSLSPTAPLHSRSTSASRNSKVEASSPQLTRTGTITFSVFSTAFAGGFSFFGFSMDPVTGYYYARPGYGGSGSVSIYPGPAALATNTPSSSVSLSNGGFYGTYFAVQNGVLFGRADMSTSAISSWNAVTGASISSSAIPNMCGGNGSCTFNWGGYSGVNWMQDSTGLYVLGTDDSNRWQVDLMNTDLSVANTQYIYPPNNALGYGFVINGHLFTGNQFDVNMINSDFNILTGIDQPVSYTLAGISSSGGFAYYFSNAFYDPTIDRLYIWDTENGILYSADHVAQQLAVTSVINFGSVSVGAAAPVQTLSYYFNNPTTLSAVNILTGGTPLLDYTDGGGSTCTAGTSYTAGQSCVVTVSFTPSMPGPRSGGVTLFAQGSNLPLMTYYLNGIGQSPAVTTDPGTQSTIATLSNGGQGFGTAIDDSGNLYVVDHVNSQVVELAAGSLTQRAVVASGLSSPTAVALDGAGNLYISDTGNARVVMVPNENGALNSADMSAVSISGLSSPLGLAVNGVGNLYVVDGANGDAVTIPAGGGTPTTVASGLTSPYGVAVDANQNVYVTADNSVTEYPFGGGSPIPMGSGYANPTSVAVDASGAVYVADAGNARIVRVAAGGASQANLAITGITNPQGVTVDGAGNVYVTDSGNMIKINRTQAAALVFANTNSGSTSTSQAVTVSNTGNQLLTVSNLAITTNFTQVPSGGSDCTSSTQLSSSGQCFIAVAFAPTAIGGLTGTATLTDNSLNAISASQSVALQGTATQDSQTITFGALSNQVLGTGPFTLSATASSGLAVSFASTTPAFCTVSGAMVTLLDVGTCTIQATQAGNANYFAATPVNQSFQVTQEAQIITFGALSNQAISTAPFTLSATASSGLAVSFASTTPAVCSVSSATVTLVATGTCTIQATQAGNINYAAATPVNQSFQVVPENQAITFTDAQTTVPTNGLSNPTGLAVDRAGNIFIVDTVNNRVVEVPTGGGAQITVASGLNGPYGGVAVDQTGDVFIADTRNNQVLEFPAGGGAQITVPANGLSNPFGVAVDAAGDVFIADSSNGRVVEVPAGGGPQITLGSGLAAPYGVTIDGAGDLFIADTYNSRVLELPYFGGGTFGPQVTVGSGLYYPTAVAVDTTGNVFIVNGGVSQQVVEVPAGGGTQTTLPLSAEDYYFGVAVDAAGDLFVAGQGNNQVLDLQRVAVNFGSASVCVGVQTTPTPCNLSVTLNYSVNENITVNNVPVVTQGTPAVDFTMASATCYGTLTAGSSCAVTGTFAPRAPGLRMGAVQLLDPSGNLLVSTMIHGQAQGPAIAFGPGVQTTVGSGLNNPQGVAVDAAGDIFISITGANQVVELPANSGPPITLGSGLLYPRGLAVDGAGDVYIADQGNSRVVVVPAGGGAQFTVGNGLNGPFGVSVDGAGNVFIADTNNQRVVEVPAGGGAQFTVGSGLNAPYDTAVDGTGNVYIADYGNSRVVEVPADGGAQFTVGSGLNQPNSVAVDGAGNVFIADTYNQRVVQVPADGSPQVTVPVPGVYSPVSVAVDGAGDVFVLDYTHTFVNEVQRAQPPAFTFASTAVGNTSSDSPQSVTIQNVGNQPLKAFVPGLIVGGPNFVQVAGSGTPVDCTSSFSLSPGAMCNVSLSFEPQTVGSLVSSATFTDNTLNAPNIATSASQSVALRGTATQDGQTITFGPLSNLALGTTPFALSATASSGLAVNFASTTSPVCTVSGTTVTLVAVGTCTIQATQTGNGIYAAATPISQSFQVTQEIQTITFGALSNRSLGIAPFALSATASSGLAVNFASTTSPVCTVSGITVTLVAVGTCTIQASQAGNTNYAVATPVNQSFQVSDFTLTSTSSSASVTAGQPGTFTLTLTPQGSFTSAITLSCGGLPAMAGCTFTPSATATPNTSAVTTTLSITTAPHTTALALNPSDHRSSPLYAVCLLLPAMFLGTLGIAKPKGRKRLSYCLVFLLVGGCLFQAACGGASPPGVNTTTGTPAGTYSVVVTGSAGSNQHTTTIMLTVK
jgi:sugar lactone lactonase YvrE